MRLGDLVIRKGDDAHIIFQINAFLDDDVLLKGVGCPVYTVAQKEGLIRVQCRRKGDVAWEILTGN